MSMLGSLPETRQTQKAPTRRSVRSLCVYPRGLQRDVLVPAATLRRLGQCLSQLAAGMRRIDLLVDDTDFDGGIHAAGDSFMLGSQFLVQRLALVLGCGGQLLFVQDADGRLGAHYRDLRVRPREHL